MYINCRKQSSGIPDSISGYHLTFSIYIYTREKVKHCFTKKIHLKNVYTVFECRKILLIKHKIGSCLFFFWNLSAKVEISMNCENKIFEVDEEGHFLKGVVQRHEKGFVAFADDSFCAIHYVVLNNLSMLVCFSKSTIHYCYHHKLPLLLLPKDLTIILIYQTTRARIYLICLTIEQKFKTQFEKKKKENGFNEEWIFNRFLSFSVIYTTWIKYNVCIFFILICEMANIPDIVHFGFRPKNLDNCNFYQHFATLARFLYLKFPITFVLHVHGEILLAVSIWKTKRRRRKKKSYFLPNLCSWWG